MKTILAAAPIVLAVFGFLFRRGKKGKSTSYEVTTRDRRSGRVQRGRRRQKGGIGGALEQLEELGVTDAVKDIAKNPKAAMKGLGIGDEKMSEGVKRQLDALAEDDRSFDLDDFLGRARQTFDLYFAALKGKNDREAKQLLTEDAYQELQRHRSRRTQLGDRKDEIVAVRIGSALVTSVNRSGDQEDIVVEFSATMPHYEKGRGGKSTQIENPFVQERWTFRRQRSSDEWLLHHREASRELDEGR